MNATNTATRLLKPRHQLNRQGGIVVLLALLLPILFVLAAFTVNLAYVQLSKTELMVATDASVRSGGRAMSHYQNVNDAKIAAQVTAAFNTVGGLPLKISANDSDNEIEFGNSSRATSAGRYLFSKLPTSLVSSGSHTANAVRVTASLSEDSLNGPLQTLFPSMGLKTTFNLKQRSVATQLDRDISLILDRSGSMSWTTFEWPPGCDPWSSIAMNAAVDAKILAVGKYKRKGKNHKYYYYTPGNNQTSYYQWAWETHFDLGRTPQAPWHNLVAAVDIFLEVLESTDQHERVSLATYATSASLDLNLAADYDKIRDHLAAISPVGSTAIGQGMQTGIPTLVEPTSARPFAAKTIIVMTDGVHNYGVDPVTVAQEVIKQYNITIHTVTFGAGADQLRMSEVASVGGGQHYHAETGEELILAFKEIANNLPTLITQSP
ncbi:MAG: vWA domain-containing protein [Planctomycetota bacterium]|nr:vWA domain-containing protein [Planctomycetota bacterium]